MWILITGGAGFIGSNLANYFLKQKQKVILYDNLLRKGSEKNLYWLKQKYEKKIKFIKKDIRDFTSLKKVIKNVAVVYHTAAQVAVTTSITHPQEDFEINASGTLNLLEAVRQTNFKPIILFTSTNKVYGKMEEIKIIKKQNKYAYANLKEGISETQPLDFYSPYGCSKGSADQYIRDYYRMYGIKTIVFRMSCIYGQHQFGNEDQGWIAHFIINSYLNQPLTIYGDGKQVRDILYIDDLIKAMVLAVKNIKKTAGQIYNIGGGKNNTISLLELVFYLEKKINKKLKLNFKNWRPGDQKIYLSDIKKAFYDFNWKPQIPKEEGINKLFYWVKTNKELFL